MTQVDIHVNKGMQNNWQTQEEKKEEKDAAAQTLWVGPKEQDELVQKDKETKCKGEDTIRCVTHGCAPQNDKETQNQNPSVAKYNSLSLF